MAKPDTKPPKRTKSKGGRGHCIRDEVLDDTGRTREETVLDALSMGMTRQRAAGAAGIGVTTLRDWVTRDPEFAAEVARCEASPLLAAAGALMDAIRSGDVAASKFVLERRDRKAWGPDRFTDRSVDLEETAHALRRMIGEIE